jgi:integrase
MLYDVTPETTADSTGGRNTLAELRKHEDRAIHSPPTWRGSTSMSPYTWFATHLLEQKGDIRVIQILLGHKRLETTALYAQVATRLLRELISPLDTLQPAQGASWSAPTWRSRISSAPTVLPGGRHSAAT